MSFGKRVEENGMCVVLHPSTPFKASLVLKQLNDWGISATSDYGAGYAILEGFVIDASAPDDTALGHYLKHRHAYESKARYEFMLTILGREDVNFIIDAFNTTRGLVAPLDVPEDEKKDTSLTTSP